MGTVVSGSPPHKEREARSVIHLPSIPWTIAPVLAQQPAPTTGDYMLQMVPILLIVVIFYFLLFRPARKRQAELAALVENLKKSDKVITNGGIYGEVAAVEGSIVLLKIADNVRIRVSKSAIAGLEASAEKGSES